MRREAVMISKIPAPPSKLEIFQTTVHKKAVFFLELSPDEAPLCLFKQTLIRLVDFYWLSKEERSQVERDDKQSETKGSTKLSLFDLVIWEMCSLSFVYPSSSSNNPSFTHTHTHTCICPEHANKSLSFILLFQKAEAKRDTEREIMRRAPYIPFNLMATVVCPVLTRNEFEPQCSP